MIRWFRPERKAVLRSPFNFYENFFTFDDPSSPCVCFSACSGCTHRWHAASNSNACHFENESGAKPSPSKRKKNTKKKKINKKYQKRKFDARTTPDTCRLFKTSQKMVRRVPTPVRPQRSRKLRLTKTPARRLDAAARYHEVLSLATLHNFSSLEVIPFRFLFTTLESSYYYSCFVIYFDTQRNTRGEKSSKIRFRSLEAREGKFVVRDRSKYYFEDLIC